MVNPVNWGATPQISSTVDQSQWDRLSGLGDVYRTAQNRQKLSELGKGLADGTIDYRQAAAATADMGNVDASLKFLALQQQRDELAGTERAGQIASGAMPGIIGAGGAPPAATNATRIAPPPTVTPGPQAPAAAVDPTAPAPATVAPAAAAPPPDKSYVTPGGTVTGSPKDETDARGNIAKIAQVLAIRNLPAGARHTYEKLLEYNIGELKDPAEIQKLRALVADPALMAAELKLRSASKPETSVSIKGEEAEAKGQSEATVDMFKEIAKTGTTARQQKAQLAQLEDLSTKFKTGGSAALQAYLATNFGVKVGKNVGAVEAYSSLVDAMTPAQRIPGSGATSDFDAKQFKAGLPQIINSPEGNQIIRGTHIALAEDKAAQADIAQRYLTKQITAKQALAEGKALPDPYALYKTWKAGQDQKQTDFKGRFDAAGGGGGWSATKVP